MEKSGKINIWRQAYSIDGSVRPAAIVMSNYDSYEEALVEFTKLYDKSVSIRDKKIYWNGLRLFSSEKEANKEIFYINSYITSNDEMV